MKVAVLLGGTSAERDVSLASGGQVIKALRDLGHQVIAIDTAKGQLTAAEEQQLLQFNVAKAPPPENTLAIFQEAGTFLTKSEDLRDIDVMFLALHGGTGEDGTIQAFLDLANIPYTGSGRSPSAYAMDKDISKRLFSFSGIPTPRWLKAPVSQNIVETEIGYPVVVKPNKQGSTVGLTIVKEPGQLNAAIEYAYQHDEEVLIEQFIEGRELTVGILDDHPLAVGEIIPKLDEIFDYQSKYQVGGADEIFPADLTVEQTQSIKHLALKAHQCLKLTGYSRVDFRMDRQGNFWCLEANTLPGMTSTSLLPQSAKAMGIGFPELCDQICQLAIKRHNQKPKKDK